MAIEVTTDEVAVEVIHMREDTEVGVEIGEVGTEIGREASRSTAPDTTTITTMTTTPRKEGSRTEGADIEDIFNDVMI